MADGGTPCFNKHHCCGEQSSVVCSEKNTHPIGSGSEYGGWDLRNQPRSTVVSLLPFSCPPHLQRCTADCERLMPLRVIRSQELSQSGLVFLAIIVRYVRFLCCFRLFTPLILCQLPFFIRLSKHLSTRPPPPLPTPPCPFNKDQQIRLTNIDCKDRKLPKPNTHWTKTLGTEKAAEATLTRVSVKTKLKVQWVFQHGKGYLSL